MPQMAPMLWLILFFYFVMLFIFYISVFYFNFLPVNLPDSNDTVSSLNSASWMW